MLHQKRTLKNILVEGISVYQKHFWTLTKPYVFPLLLQVLGVIGWVTLSYTVVQLSMDWPIWLRWAAFIGANILGMSVFVRGFWDYLVWFAALNLVVRDVYEGNPVLDNAAYTLRVTNRSMDYSLIWVFLFGLFIVPVGLAAIPMAVVGLNLEWMGPAFVIGGIALLVGLLVASLLTLFCAMVFQLFIFQPASAGASLFRSADLVRLNFVKVLVVSVVSFAITQNILPMVITGLFDLSHLTNVLGAFALKPFVDVLQQSAESALANRGQYPDYLIYLYQLILLHPAQLGLEITRWTVYTISAALVVPLGTCWFALLYGDLKACKDEEKSGQAVFISSAGQAVSTGE